MGHPKLPCPDAPEVEILAASHRVTASRATGGNRWRKSPAEIADSRQIRCRAPSVPVRFTRSLPRSPTG